MTKRVKLFLLLLAILIIALSNSLFSQSTKTFVNKDRNSTLITGVILDDNLKTIETYGKRYLGEYAWGKRKLQKVSSDDNSSTYKVVYRHGIAIHTLYITQENYSNQIKVVTETQYQGHRPEYADVRNFQMRQIQYNPSPVSPSFDGVGAANK